MGAAHEHRAAAGIAHDLAAARNPAKLARVGAADAELVGVAPAVPLTVLGVEKGEELLVA